MRTGSQAVVGLLVVVLAVGCSANPPSPSAPPAPVPTSQPAMLAMSNVGRAPVQPSLAPVAASAANAFGLDLFAAVRAGAPDSNIVLSPTSIAIALAMARAGARGQTATEMDTVLYSLGDDAHAAAINALDAALNGRSGTFRGADGKFYDLTLTAANAPFAQSDYAWEQPFLDALASRFGAGVQLVDYAKDREGARRQINAWVADQTQQRIPELIGPGGLDGPPIRLVLVNAVYLKAPWLWPFRAEATADGPFTLLDGSTVTAPMMSQADSFAFAQGDGWRAVELPYIDGKLALTLVLPDDFANFAASFDAARLNEITAALMEQEVIVVLPRFSFETKADLAQALSDMGMSDAFVSGKADFSGMTSEEPLFIWNVIHQANISVDEQGTEASGATDIPIAAGTSAPGGPPQVRLDRPFLFALRDLDTGAVLFLGQVLDPTLS
jgi:serpin B